MLQHEPGDIDVVAVVGVDRLLLLLAQRRPRFDRQGFQVLVAEAIAERLQPRETEPRLAILAVANLRCQQCGEVEGAGEVCFGTAVPVDEWRTAATGRANDLIAVLPHIVAIDALEGYVE